MPIRYSEHRPYRKIPIIRVLFAANFSFAVITLIAWQWALVQLLSPLTWAVDQSLPHAHDLSQLIQYPLILYWLGPAFAMAVAWTLIQNRHYSAAFGVLALPMMIMAITFVMYWMVPGARL